MKIYVYSVRDDEKAYLERYMCRDDVEITLSPEEPTQENASSLAGFDGVSILGQTKIVQPLLDEWKRQGIRYLSTRTIGYNHIDVAYARSIGMRVCNANYAPNGVADFTVMMMLLVLRNYKPSLWRGQVYDFSLEGLQGREMRSLTVGIIGTGRIGTAVIQNLSGFGCKMLAYDIRENEAVKKWAAYVDLKTLYQESDIITLHMPLLESTYHLIDREAIHQMKDGVILVNCARGELMNLDDLIDELESGKIGGLGLDTVESEEGLIHLDLRTKILNNRRIAYIRQFPNVVMTQHMAFYTREAVESMVRCGIEGILDMAKNPRGQTEIDI